MCNCRKDWVSISSHNCMKREGEFMEALQNQGKKRTSELDLRTLTMTFLNTTRFFLWKVEARFTSLKTLSTSNWNSDFERKGTEGVGEVEDISIPALLTRLTDKGRRSWFDLRIFLGCPKWMFIFFHVRKWYNLKNFSTCCCPVVSKEEFPSSFETIPQSGKKRNFHRSNPSISHLISCGRSLQD